MIRRVKSALLFGTSLRGLLDSRIVGLAALGAVHGLANAQCQIFDLTLQYPAGNEPAHMVVVDIDGDGDLDVATANRIGDNIGVARNNGDGTFGSTTNYTAGNGPVRIAAGDIDGDNDLDLVTCNSLGDTVSVFRNNGNGTFGPKADFSTGTNTNPTWVELEHVDADGRIDIITSNFDTDNVSLLYGNGNGTFGTLTQFTVGNEPESIACAQLDGNQSIDVVVLNTATGANSVSVLRNTGNRVLSVTTYPVSSSPRDIAIADINQDGHLDLLVGCSNGTLSRYLNNGAGLFGNRADFDAPPATFATCCVRAGDINGDDQIDVVMSQVDVLQNSALFVVFCGNGMGSFAPCGTYSDPDGSEHMALVDIDQDADLDVVLASELSDDIDAWINSGAGVFACHSAYASGNNPVYVVTADMNDDGGVDVVAINKDDDSFAILLNSCSNRPACRANFNSDCAVNSQDFFDFLSCFFTPGCPGADFNLDGFVNSQDFFDFITAFFSPC